MLADFPPVSALAAVKAKGGVRKRHAPASACPCGPTWTQRKPRRGYRFLAPVQPAGTANGPPRAAPAATGWAQAAPLGNLPPQAATRVGRDQDLATVGATLLQTAPGVRLLVTSQQPLRLSSEQLLPLAPLGLPADVADAAPAPASYAAAQLFCQRVAQQQPGYIPSTKEHADIAAICRALDGAPLALELAAARVPLLGVADVRARLEERCVLLTRAPRDAAARHRTLAAALDWTFKLLSLAEQTALQRLGVFAGSFTTKAAVAALDSAQAGGPMGALDLVDSLREAAGLLLVDERVWWIAGALAWAAWHDGRTADADRLQCWADAQAQQRADSRRPLLMSMRDGLLKALGETAILPTQGDAFAAISNWSQADVVALALGPQLALGTASSL